MTCILKAQMLLFIVYLLNLGIGKTKGGRLKPLPLFFLEQVAKGDGGQNGPP